MKQKKIQLTMQTVRAKTRLVLQMLWDMLRGPVWHLIRHTGSVMRDVTERLFGGARSRRMLFRSVKGEVIKAVERNKKDITTDFHRRAFLKYVLFGSVVFLAGKYTSPLINALRGETVLSEKTFENFKLTETGKKLLVTDDDGEEILTIDKESF